MKYHHQLAGRGTPLPTPMPGRLIACAVILVTLALSYGGWKIISLRKSQGPSISRAEKISAPSEEGLDDAENHLRHIQVLLVTIEQEQSGIHKRLRQISPVLEENYLDLEHRRIENADLLTQSILHDAGEALDELQLAKENLTGGNPQWHSK